MSAAPRMTFNGVWPTLLVRRQLPGYQQSNAGLAAYIYEQEKREADYTVRYEEQNFLGAENSAVRWLRDQVNQTVSSLLLHAGIHVHSWRLHSWYNVNRYGDHHAPHTHPRSYLSGTYYVRVPDVPPVGDPHSHPACISFYDPRTGANMITAGTEPDARAAYLVHPSSGTLMMWPSPLQHSVHPNLSQEDRISISFNVLMEPAPRAS